MVLYRCVCLLIDCDAEVLASYNDEDIYLFDCTQPEEKCTAYLQRYTGHRNNATGKAMVTSEILNTVTNVLHFILHIFKMHLNTFFWNGFTPIVALVIILIGDCCDQQTENQTFCPVL